MDTKQLSDMELDAIAGRHDGYEIMLALNLGKVMVENERLKARLDAQQPATALYALLSSDTRDAFNTYGLSDAALTMARTDLLRRQRDMFEKPLLERCNTLFPAAMAGGGLRLGYVSTDEMGVFWEVTLDSDPSESIEDDSPANCEALEDFLYENSVAAMALVNDSEQVCDLSGDRYYLIQNTPTG